MFGGTASGHKDWIYSIEYYGSTPQLICTNGISFTCTNYSRNVSFLYAFWFCNIALPSEPTCTPSEFPTVASTSSPFSEAEAEARTTQLVMHETKDDNIIAKEQDMFVIITERQVVPVFIIMIKERTRTQQQPDRANDQIK
eukprot:30663_1